MLRIKFRTAQVKNTAQILRCRLVELQNKIAMQKSLKLIF